MKASTTQHVVFFVFNGCQLLDYSGVAAFMNMSPRNFSRRFKSIVGLSPQQYFTQLKVEHAKDLLNRGYANHQICKAVGYENQQSFNRAFEQHVGLSMFQYQTNKNRRSQ